ncbi:5'-AMP-activated protein kinase beta subunit, interation domain-containing protein [Mycena galericulata]|nr:5'-AMP-activated protein kinase beta subunit, interation domain-containing protein [Mycena galericulata]
MPVCVACTPHLFSNLVPRRRRHPPLKVQVGAAATPRGAHEQMWGASIPGSVWQATRPTAIPGCVSVWDWRLLGWSPTGPFTTTIHLPPGTHHFRFIVDGETVVAPATEIPNAVDDQGFIANYVAVPGPVGTTTPSTASAPPTSASAAAAVAAAAAAASKGSSVTTSSTVSPSASTGGRPPKRRRPSLPVHPDGSFWARSSAGGSHEDIRLAERVVGSAGAAGGFGFGSARGAGWTSTIPEALVRAAAQEEAWLDSQQNAPPPGGRDGSRGRHIVLNGFVPEPTIPPAPRLPRHLERLILNRPSPGVVIPRVGTGAGNGGASGSSMNAVGGAPSPALRVTTASGTDVSVPMMSFTSAANGSGAGAATPSLERPAPHPQFGGGGLPSPALSNRGPPSPNNAGIPLIADDPSVLQTPSHAVLYHLCTSSIRDKMIAVGASTRYRQKYLTTVYYKPAVPAGQE